MGYFTARERSALGKSVNARPPTRARELARDDYAPRRPLTNTDINSLVQQVRDGSVARVDALIAQLQQRRDAIVEESMRMQRAVVAYAELNRSTMDASRVISDSLANLVKLRDAPAINELVDAVSDPRDRDSATEPSAETNESHELTAGSSLLDVPAGVRIAPEYEASSD